MTKRTLKAVYLYPQSTFRGEMRSDTLWGMICWGIRFLYGEKELVEMLKNDNRDNFPFIISSTFPFAEKKEGKSHFFPRPYMPQMPFSKLPKPERKTAIADMQARKAMKDIAFMEKKVLEKLCKEGFNAETLMQALKTEKAVAIPKVKSDSMTHNTIDRLRNGTLEKDEGGQLFHTEEKYVHFAPIVVSGDTDNSAKAGLFFLVDVKATGIWKKLEAVFRFWQHTGIGGDRNIGKGFFEIKTGDFEVEESEQANAYLLLSLCKPSEQDLNMLETKKESPLFNYQLVFRKGFAYNRGNEKKETVACFTEGSIFPIQKITGTITNVGQKKDIEVYHNGCAFFLKINVLPS